MIVLQEVQEPVENIMDKEEQVVAYFEKDCLGQGTLFLTERQLVWTNLASKRGIQLPIPSIVIHAASGSSEDFPEPCFYMMVDVDKAGIEYVADQEAQEDDEDDDEVRTIAMRFIPANSERISELFAVMNTCQELNPEPEEDMNGSIGEDEFEDAEGGDPFGLEPHNGNNHHTDAEEATDPNGWFTSDSRTDEIRLSAEGRANLERIVGSLSDLPDMPGTGGQQQPDSNSDDKKGEEQMDEN